MSSEPACLALSALGLAAAEHLVQGFWGGSMEAAVLTAVSGLQPWSGAVSHLPGRAEGPRLPALQPRVLPQVHQPVAGASTDALSLLQGCHGRCGVNCLRGAQVLQPPSARWERLLGRVCEEILNSEVVNTSRVARNSASLALELNRSCSVVSKEGESCLDLCKNLQITES